MKKQMIRKRILASLKSNMSTISMMNLEAVMRLVDRRVLVVVGTIALPNSSCV